jgi:hypothetical protein
MDLVVDPKLRRVTPNPAHPDGPVFRARCVCGLRMTGHGLRRRLALGEVFKSGAFPCRGFLALSEFAPEFARWQISARMEEVPA